MDHIDEFLEQCRAQGLSGAKAPKDRLAAMEAHPDAQDPRIRAAVAWWHARYRFTTRKKTETLDTYIYMLLCLQTSATKGVMGRPTATGDFKKAYKQAFVKPETDAAMALDDRLYPHLLDACILYIPTVATQTSVFGIKVGKTPEGDDKFDRIARTVAGLMLPALWHIRRDSPEAGPLMRALCEACETCYPGIRPHLESWMEQCRNDECKAFMAKHTERTAV